MSDPTLATTNDVMPATQLPPMPSSASRTTKRGIFAAGVAMGLSLATTGAIGYFLGVSSQQTAQTASQSLGENGMSIPALTPEMLQAAASHGGENMAIATGAVGDEAEGFFALDFISGTIQGFVINPRRGGITGKYMFNVQEVLGGPSKNPQYLLVSGTARLSASSQSSILYVVNTNTGLYAALGVPWDKTLEASGNPQGGTLSLLTTGVLREPVGLGRRPLTPPAAGPNRPANPRAGGANNPKPAAGTPAGAPGAAENEEDPFAAGPANPNAPGNPRKQR